MDVKKTSVSSGQGGVVGEGGGGGLGGGGRRWGIFESGGGRVGRYSFRGSCQEE